MENKTAIRWLKERLPSLFTNDSGHYKELFEQALEMEKEQIIIAYQSERFPCSNQDAEDYYNTTFKKD